MLADAPLVALAVLALALLAVGGYFVWERMRHGRPTERERRGTEPLPLFTTEQMAPGAPRRPVPVSTAPAAPATRPDLPGEERTATMPAVRPPAANGTRAPGDRAPSAAPNGTGGDAGNGARERFAPRPAEPARPLGAQPWSAPAPATATLAGPASAAARLEAAMHEGETVRFSIPEDGTLQFLPGRLEIVAGPDVGRDVRFVRMPGDDAVEVTFGRSEGPAYRHVQLLARTVSRQHATMTLTDGHWALQNLSSTNPVVLNGRALAPNEVAPLLVEGDRIEMGEIAFVFHAR